MVRIEGEIVIDRPVGEVFDFVADERNEPRYNPHMRRAEQISDGPIGVGTRFRAEISSMGRTMEMAIEFTGYERPRRLASSTHMSSMDTRGALTFDPVPEGTRMRWSWDVEPRGMFRAMGPLVARIGRRQEQTIWSGLKRLLEGGGTDVRPTPQSREVSRRAGGRLAEVAPGVYCLRTGRGISESNVYFVRSDPSWTLIDAGWAKDGPSIKSAAEYVFGADTRPASILLTHAHPDHAGSALELARIWDRAVYMHPDEVPLATGDFSAMSVYAGPLDNWVVLPLMRAMGRRRRESMLARSSLGDVARAFEPSAEVPGLPGWKCVPTPGHTPGHVAFLRTSDHVLITGDAVVTVKLNSLSGLLLQKRGLSGPPWYTTWSWRAAKESVATLAGLEPSVLAGGHGTPMTRAGTASALRALSDQFRGRATKRPT